MKLTEVIILVLQILLILFKERTDPKQKFARQLEEIVDDWLWKVEKFREAVAEEDAAGVKRGLVAIRRSKLRHTGSGSRD